MLPKLIGPGFNRPAIRTDAKAHHYRLIGLEILSGPAEHSELVYLGEQRGSDGDGVDINNVPHHIIIDRCYIHGHPQYNLYRAIALNSAHTEIINSHISECHVEGFEGQGILGWNGPGPYKIINNRIEAAGINVMFGGTAAKIFNVIPSDIEIRRNHLFKPLLWRIGDPSRPPTETKRWTVKNLLELKVARRVVIDGNILENSWLDAQTGFAVLFALSRINSWAVLEDVEFTNNIVRHTAFGIQLNNIEGRAARITIRNNLFDDINGQRWFGNNESTAGHFLTFQNGVDGLTIDHNTVFHDGSVTSANGASTTSFVFTNNLMAHNTYGVFGASSSSGLRALDDYFRGYSFQRNLIAGANPNFYPTNNEYPASIDDARFVDKLYGDYRLADSSPYKNRGTDNKDIGCDIAQLHAAVGIPARPTNLALTSFTCQNVTLVWTDNSSNEDKFVVERKKQAFGTWSKGVELGANVTTYSEYNLGPDHYYYRVKAVNSFGVSSYSNIVGGYLGAGCE